MLRRGARRSHAHAAGEDELGRASHVDFVVGLAPLNVQRPAGQVDLRGSTRWTVEAVRGEHARRGNTGDESRALPSQAPPRVHVHATSAAGWLPAACRPGTCAPSCPRARPPPQWRRRRCRRPACGPRRAPTRACARAWGSEFRQTLRGGGVGGGGEEGERRGREAVLSFRRWRQRACWLRWLWAGQRCRQQPAAAAAGGGTTRSLLAPVLVRAGKTGLSSNMGPMRARSRSSTCVGGCEQWRAAVVEEPEPRLGRCARLQPQPAAAPCSKETVHSPSLPVPVPCSTRWPRPSP